jgi:Xaa-Pro aminopeptidase
MEFRNIKSDAPYLHRGGDETNTRYLIGEKLSKTGYIIVGENNRRLICHERDAKNLDEDDKYEEKILFSNFINSSIQGDIEKECRALINSLDYLNIDSLEVEPHFPSYLVENLKSENFDIHIKRYNPVTKSRESKNKEEINLIKALQSQCEEAMQEVRKSLLDADIDQTGNLRLDGDALTSKILKERIKSSISISVTWPRGLIASHGIQTAKPHHFGEGTLQEGEPIVVDIFPKAEHGYFADMTRTFVKGNPPQEILDMHSAISESMEKALEIVEEGVDKSDVHNKVCEVLEEKGYETGRDSEEGFIHSTGHGVGLDIHENPNLDNQSGELVKNSLITVEPGLYIKQIGGVRCEDIVRVTEEGYENFNNMTRNLQVIE